MDYCIRTLKLNGFTLESPVCWFGLSVIESNEFQLEVFKKSKIQAFLSNTFDLKYQDKNYKRRKLISSLLSQGMVHKVDSGGFQLMKTTLKEGKNIDLNQNIAYETQMGVKPHLIVQLDYPFSPNFTVKERKTRIRKTIDNYKKLSEISNDSNIPLMPVIHGYNTKDIDNMIGKFESILGDIKILGIGSLVPMVKNMDGSEKIGGKFQFLKNLIYLRKKLPNVFIHAFGIGGTMTYLGVLCGIDSFDSNGWVQKSGYGVIQLPGVSDRFTLKKDHGRPFLMRNRKTKNGFTDEIQLFLDCECSACKEYQKLSKKAAWERKSKDFDGYSEEARKLRAIHNVSLYQNEVEHMRIHIKENDIQGFVENRLKNSRYLKHIAYIKDLTNKTTEEIAKI